MVNLHLHTKYSLLDAIIKIDELMDRLVELGQTACAITDHGNMYGAIEFYKSAKEHNIKPIIGCEVYICSDVTIMKRDNKMYHLILLAKDEVGRLNLQKLVTESTHYKFNKRPRIDFEMLKKYHEGLICCSACMIGEVAWALRNGNTDEAYDIARKYKELFGEDYYIEYQAHTDSVQQVLNKQLIQLAIDLGIEYIVTCDSHYLHKDDQKYHNIFVQIGQSRETGETYNDCYVQSEDEILKHCESTKEYNRIAIENTHKIADKCNVEYPLSAPIIPHTIIPQNFSSEEEYLKQLCNEGWVGKGFSTWTLNQWKNYMSEDIYDYNGNFVEHRDFITFDTVDEIKQIYFDRLKYEMNSVVKMGFEGYYLLVRSYISSAYRRGIARGSAGGSLIAYLCGIVDIDPIKYGLYFERFIDVGALDLLDAGEITKKELKIPDVDADFSTTNREQVMRYIINTYGSNNVVCLGTFQYIWAKGAIKDIGKVLGIPFEITNEMTKVLDNESIDEALELGLLDKYKNKYPELFIYASKLAGLPKSYGMHACGKVITMQEATFYNALEYNTDEDTYSLQGDMRTADDLGLVKVDLLGLRTLDVIYDVLEMIGKDYNYIAPHTIDLCDKAVWKEFMDGNSLQIFQFESLGMRQMLKDMKCNSIDDLSAANALYRPGSKDYIPNYIARKNKLEPIKYINPMLEPILKSTYGIIVYQEQLIEIGRLAGLKNPDELRKATAKKKIKLMAKIEPEMKQGLINKGWTENQVNTLWDDIIKFAKYSFNKSHSAAYGLTAYITMFLKVHHPAEFITASINSYDGKTDKIAGVIMEAKRMGVNCVWNKWGDIPPITKCENNTVYLGMNVIKNLNSSVAEELHTLSQSRTYTNFFDLLKDITEKTSLNSRQLDILIRLDRFSDFGEAGALLYQTKLFDRVYDKGKGYKTKIKESKMGLKYETVSPFCNDYKPLEVKEVNIDAIATAITEPTRQQKFWEIVEQCKKYKKDGTFNGYNYEKLFKLTEMPEEIKIKYATKISEAEYRELDAYKLLTSLDYSGIIRMTIKEKIKAEQEFLSYISYTDPTLDKRYIVITDLDDRYSPKFTAYCLNNGATCQMKVRKNKKGKTGNVVNSFKDTPFENGDILYMINAKQEPKAKMVDGEWQRDYSDREWWLYAYKVVDNITNKGDN